MSNMTKVKLYETFVVPIVLYGSECWCLKKEDERRIPVAEMTCMAKEIVAGDKARPDED